MLGDVSVSQPTASKSASPTSNCFSLVLVIASRAAYRRGAAGPVLRWSLSRLHSPVTLLDPPYERTRTYPRRPLVDSAGWGLRTMQATEYFNVGRWANFGRRPDPPHLLPLPPLPHQHRRPKWRGDDGQSIKTLDRSHYEFRLILHRRLITHTHTRCHAGRTPSRWTLPAIHIHLQARAYITFSGKDGFGRGR